MSWGTKLILTMVCFMTFIVTMGVLMFTSKTDALVDNDYYEKGINYNSDYSKKENVKQEHAEPKVVILNDSLIVTFAKPATGELRLIRTADKRLDKSMVFESLKAIKYEITKKGLWKIRLTWQSEDKSYLYEKEVLL
jgi:hypothetical protein